MWARHGERRRSKRPDGSAPVPATALPADEPNVVAAVEPLFDPAETALDAARIDMLLHDVRDLRTLLALDLSAAAGAADAGADDVLSDIVDADRAAVADLVARAERLTAADAVLERMTDEERAAAADVSADAASRPRRSGRLGRLLPAAPLAVAAAVIAAVVTGTIPVPSGPSTVRSQPVAASWHRFTEAAGSDNERQLLAAAEQLHRSLAAYVDLAGDDPSKAREAMKLLQMEQMLLLRERPPGMDLILAQSQQLIAALQSTLDDAGLPDLTTATGGTGTATGAPRPVTRLVVPLVKPPSRRTRSSAGANPSPSASAAPKPATSPSASPTASPSPSPSNPFGPLPTSPAPNFTK